MILATGIALAGQPSQVTVRDFGAKGDGVTDDTQAFASAMKAVAEKGGTVQVPVGNYLIETHLNIPANVTLEGIWKIPTAWTQYEGSTLLAVEGEGSETGPAFITLNRNSTIKGITVFYPNQKPDDIKPYPWCVACAGGDNPSIIDCLLVNPYQGVDFGTNASGRHYIRNLYGQPLRRGIFVDKCLDIGRIENVHFWPFWKWDDESGIKKWLTDNGEAFIFARTDWEYVLNTFCFGYGIGYRFIRSEMGVMNGNLLGIGADAANISVLVDDCEAIGLLITNGEFASFMGENPTGLVVRATSKGTVQFQNCSFWGGQTNVARIAGQGMVSFNNCNFIWWDYQNKNVPAIETFGGKLMVNGCYFRHAAPQVSLRDRTESAVITGNSINGPLAVYNTAGANLALGVNSFQKPPERPREEKNAIVVDDRDGAEKVQLVGSWSHVENLKDRNIGYYLGTHWAVKGKGEAKAIFKLIVPKSGLYDVYAYFGPDPMKDHATNAPVIVHSAVAVDTVRIDLSKRKGEWVKIGSYKFSAGKNASVTFSNNADGNVLADAVKLVSVN